MKKIVLSLFILVATLGMSIGQTFKKAYYDSEYILSKVPEYEKAQKELDGLAQKWQSEVEAFYKQAEELYKAYQQEEVLLSDEMKRTKQDEILNKEAEAEKLKQKYFASPDGDLAKKEKELMDPIMNDMLNAVKEVAQEGSYTEVEDLALNPAITYHDPRFDESDTILKKMGYGQ